MKLFEKILCGMILLGILMKIFHLPGSSILLVLSTGILSVFYMYLGFALFNGIQLRGIFKKDSYTGKSTQRIVFTIYTGFALSILLVGIVFSIQHWPGAIINLTAGLVPILIAIIMSIFKFIKTKSLFYKNILIRLTIFEIIGLYLFISTMSFIR